MADPGATPPPDGVRLRWATEADAEAGARLHVDCWREAYRPLVDPGLLEAQLADLPSWVQRWRDTATVPRLLAEADEGLVGFAVAGPATEPDAPEPEVLFAAYVRAARLGTGLGSALVHGVLGDWPAYLWVLEDNARARAFYDKLGFAFDGRRQRFDPLDAWMVRMVRPPRMAASLP